MNTQGIPSYIEGGFVDAPAGWAESETYDFDDRVKVRTPKTGFSRFWAWLTGGDMFVEHVWRVRGEQEYNDVMRHGVDGIAEVCNGTCMIDALRKAAGSK